MVDLYDADGVAKALASNRELEVDDLLVLEGLNDGPENAIEYYLSLQRQINSGLIWKMQGSMGRTAMAAIQNGDVMVGGERHKDYYGNTMPARSDLGPGTKGTYDFVVAHHDKEWADKLVAVGS